VPRNAYKGGTWRMLSELSLALREQKATVFENSRIL
jgi:hypothetical protein